MIPPAEIGQTTSGYFRSSINIDTGEKERAASFLCKDSPQEKKSTILPIISGIALGNRSADRDRTFAKRIANNIYENGLRWFWIDF